MVQHDFLGINNLMASRKRSKSAVTPLIVESHPSDYKGYPFITLIQYRDEHVLTIIDNADEKVIEAFVLDLCNPEQVDEELVIAVASEWYDSSRERYPISFEFSKRKLTYQTSRIHRSYPINFVSRVIGPMPKFVLDEVTSVKTRRRKPVPPGVEIRRKLLEMD